MKKIQQNAFMVKQPLRKHLMKYIEKGRMSPSLSSHCRKHGKSETIPVYCACRVTDDETKMIECADSKEWYHLACVEVEKKFVVNRKTGPATVILNFF